MKIDRIDHIVLTVRDIDATVAFYTGALGMEARRFAGGRLLFAVTRRAPGLPIAPAARGDGDEAGERESHQKRA
jgi:catechol 2,3-dioxygenase-like lactoylglutathione lyase family enzyme